MIRHPNLYFHYKIIDKLLGSSLKNEFGFDFQIKLNPHRYFLNRTQYQYWINAIEKVEIQIKQPVLLVELKLLENQIIQNLNMIFISIGLEDYNEIKGVDLVIIKLEI